MMADLLAIQTDLYIIFVVPRVKEKKLPLLDYLPREKTNYWRQLEDIQGMIQSKLIENYHQNFRELDATKKEVSKATKFLS